MTLMPTCKCIISYTNSRKIKLAELPRREYVASCNAYKEYGTEKRWVLKASRRITW
jgi:hypothetical protein